jgi:Transposase and inactivated derivatives
MTYPKELRERVIVKNAAGDTQPEIAEELAVSLGWVNKVLQCYATYGELFPPRKKMGRPRKFSEHALDFLRQLVDAEPDLTLGQFAERMSEHLGIAVNQVNIFDALKALGYSHKKNVRPK